MSSFFAVYTSFGYYSPLYIDALNWKISVQTLGYPKLADNDIIGTHLNLKISLDLNKVL